MDVDSSPTDSPNVDMKSPQLPSPESLSDPATSLRAAALLTLKSKRRKPILEPPLSGLPPRPVPQDSLQLDYGQDESVISPTATTPPPGTSTSKLAPAQLEVEDGQLREEGEISDSEEPPPAPPKKRPVPQERSPPPKKSKKNMASAYEKNVPLKPTQSTAWSAIPGKLEPPNKDKGKAKEVPQPFGLVIPPLGHSLNETPLYGTDSDHIRPGLSMTHAQYETAKDIILDLLGWGVLPEYLLDCGLSRHIIYYAFSELQLRLPDNFDTSGLLPYPPPGAESVSSTPPRSRRPTMESSSLPLPPPRRNTSPASTSQSLSGHPSLAETSQLPDATSKVPFTVPVEPSPTPIKAPVPQNAVLGRSPLTPATPAPVTTNLHDIEQQRRQELLARKAVIASRKAKQQAAASSMPVLPPELKDQDTEMVPTETVDDFLKTIGPSNDENGKSPSHDVENARDSSLDAMEVDELIPGFVASELDGVAPTPTTSILDTDVPSGSVQQEPLASSGPVTGTGPHKSVSPVDSAVDSSAADSDSGHEGVRRGTKRRAVASDFVDFELSRINGHENMNGGSSLHANHVIRRKMGSGFASVSGMRRCVIDLSDSEDDGDGRTITLDYGEGEYEGRLSPDGLRVGQTSTPLGGGSGYNTPPSFTSSTAMTPAALMEKEQEIARMRELIKQREQLRKKKLATINTGSSTPVDTPASFVSGQTTSVKQGDDGTNGHIHDRSNGIMSDADSAPLLDTSESATPIGSLSRFLASPTTG